MRAVGSNEDVARYSGINVARVRTITYVLQGLCVAIAVIVYVPRLSSASSTTGLGWELTAITAVVVGGTRLKGGVGRVWGTIAGALILEVIGNIMLLSNVVSEYLIGAVQGAIIIIAMLAQRSWRVAGEDNERRDSRLSTSRRGNMKRILDGRGGRRLLLAGRGAGAGQRRPSRSRCRPPTTAGPAASSISRCRRPRRWRRNIRG